jgi:hypothetical protein
MSERHVSASALEGYVIGAMGELEAAALEEHVASCRSCEARLQQEARLDLAFTAVAARESARPRRRFIERAPLALAGSALAVSCAAAMLLWVLPHGEMDRDTSASEPPPVTAEINADASTATAQLDVQADGAPRVGVRD